jgi:hypothetical protein
VNELELETLQTPLSNLARVLYCLYLRPQMSGSSNTIEINNKAILALINNKKPVITMGRQISALFEELHSVGLIEVVTDTDFSKSLHNQEITLPLTALPQSLETHSSILNINRCDSIGDPYNQYLRTYVS